MDILLGWTSFTLMSQPLAAYHYSFSRIEMNLHLVSHLCLDGEIYFDRKSIFLRFLEPKRPVAVSGDSRYSTPALANCGHPKEVLQRNVEEDPQKELVGQVVPRDVCWGLKEKEHRMNSSQYRLGAAERVRRGTRFSYMTPLLASSSIS